MIEEKKTPNYFSGYIENKIHVERIKDSLQKYNIRDVITYYLLFARARRDLSASNSGKRRLSRVADRLIEREEFDILLSRCLQIARILVFEVRIEDKPAKNTGKLDDASLKKANLLLADFLFGASVNLSNEKEASKLLQIFLFIFF